MLSFCLVLIYFTLEGESMHMSTKNNSDLKTDEYFDNLILKRNCLAEWEYHDGNCIRAFGELGETLLSWDDAVKKCQEYGATLPSIHDVEKQDFLYTLISRKGIYQSWIGLRYWGDAPQWDDGSYSLNELWKTSENDTTGRRNESKKCMVMCTTPNCGMWERVNCNDTMPYICQINLSTKLPPEKPSIAGDKCLDKPSYWRYFGGKYCYFFGTRNHVSWYEANTLCILKGGFLASIHSEEEKMLIRASLSDLQLFQIYHIGLYREHGAENFTWIDGSDMDFQFRLPKENNRVIANRKCSGLLIDCLKWIALPCDVDASYICALKKVSPPSGSWGLSSASLSGVVFCFLLIIVILGVLVYCVGFKEAEKVKQSQKDQSLSRCKALQEIEIREDSCHIEKDEI